MRWLAKHWRDLKCKENIFQTTRPGFKQRNKRPRVKFNLIHHNSTPIVTQYCVPKYARVLSSSIQVAMKDRIYLFRHLWGRLLRCISHSRFGIWESFGDSKCTVRRKSSRPPITASCRPCNVTARFKSLRLYLADLEWSTRVLSWGHSERWRYTETWQLSRAPGPRDGSFIWLISDEAQADYDTRADCELSGSVNRWRFIETWPRAGPAGRRNRPVNMCLQHGSHGDHIIRFRFSCEIAHLQSE